MRLQLLVLLSWLSALIAAAYAAQKAVQPQGTAPKTNLTGHQKLAKLDEQLKTFTCEESNRTHYSPPPQVTYNDVMEQVVMAGYYAMWFVMLTNTGDIYQAFGEVISQPDESSIMAVAFSCVLFVIFLLALIIAALVTWICIFCAFKKRWNEKGYEPSGSKKCSVLVNFIASAIFVAAGTVLFICAMHVVAESTKTVGEKLEGAGIAIVNQTKSFASDIKCGFHREVSALRSKPQFIAFGNDYAATIRLLTVDTSSDVASLSNGQAKQELENLRRDLKNITDQLNAATNGEKQVDLIVGVIQNQLDDVKKLTDSIEGNANSFQDKLRKAMSDKTVANDIVTGLQYASFIPIVPFGFLMLGFIFCCLRFMCAFSVSDPSNPHRSVVSSIAGNILGIGGYVCLVVGGLLFLATAGMFALGFAAQVPCVALKEDHNLKILQTMKLESTVKYAGQTITVSLAETMDRCRRGFTFFDAIGGEKVFAKKSLAGNFSSLRPHFSYKLRRLTVSDATYNTVNGLQGADALKNQLKILRSEAAKDDLAYGVNSEFDKFENELSASVGKLFLAVVESTQECDPLIGLTEGIGEFICHDISAPLQVAWIATLMTAVGSTVVNSALFDSTAFLKSFGNSSKRSEESPTAPTHGKPSSKKRSKSRSKDSEEDTSHDNKKSKKKSHSGKKKHSNSGSGKKKRSNSGKKHH